MILRVPRGLAIGLMVGGLAARGKAGHTQEPVAPSAVTLPAPTGHHAVGRMVLLLTDSTRHETFSSDPAARREVVVYLWYPSRTGTREPHAPYLLDFPVLQRAAGDSALRQLLGQSYDVIRAGRLETHARTDAPPAPVPARYALILFSPGFEETAQTYASVLEDLASHGYVVAAIDHPYDALGIATPDGRAIPFAGQAWETALAAGPDSIIGYFKARVEVWAADSRFVLDRLLGGAAAGVPRLDRRLDVGRVGAFGHSMGGLATARLCQLDRRVRACMNQDSDYRGVPLLDFGDGATLTQPFMFFASDHSLIIARHKPLPAGADTVKLRRQQAAQDSALGHLPAGGYRVGVETPGFNHRSFMDDPILHAPGGLSPGTRWNLTIVRIYTRAFFDRYLGRGRTTALDAAPLDSAVTIERFPRERNSARPARPD